MVYHAVKITNDMRPNTCDVSLALDDAPETVSRHFNVDATIGRAGRDDGVELMLFQDLRGRSFKGIAIEEFPI